MSLNSPPPRRFSRRAVELPVRIFIPQSDFEQPQRAFVRDLSQEGARIFSDLPLLPGQTVRLIPNEGLEYAVPGRVVWSRVTETPSGHEAGVEFLAGAL